MRTAILFLAVCGIAAAQCGPNGHLAPLPGGGFTCAPNAVIIGASNAKATCAGATTSCAVTVTSLNLTDMTGTLIQCKTATAIVAITGITSAGGPPLTTITPSYSSTSGVTCTVNSGIGPAGPAGATGATGPAGSNGTNGTNGAISRIYNGGSAMPVEPFLNFVAGGCVDNSGATRTDCTVAGTPVLTPVTFSATPTFAISNTTQGFTITLTGNVTSSTFSGTPTDGQEVWFRICQDATGGRSFVYPTSVNGATGIDTTASVCTAQLFKYIAATTTYAAVGIGSSNNATPGLTVSGGNLVFPSAPDTLTGLSHTPQKYFGTAAPGSVAGNLPGDLYSDTTNHNAYWCNAASGTAAPACTSVTAGGWTLLNGGGSGGGSVFTGSTATAPTFSATPTFSLADVSVKSPTRVEPGVMSANVTAVTFSNKTAGAKFSIVWTQAASGGPFTVTYGASVSNTPCAISATASATTEHFFEVGSDGATVTAVGCISSDGVADLSAVNLKLPAASSFVATATNNIGVDTATGFTHLWENADTIPISKVTVNGSGSGTNLSDSAPTATAGYVNAKWQISAANMSAEILPALQGTANAIGSAGATQTIVTTNGAVQTMTLSANLTVSFTQPSSGTARLTLFITQAASGGPFTVTWTSVKWPGGIAPVMTSSASAVDAYSCFLDGTNTFCTAGQNFQ